MIIVLVFTIQMAYVNANQITWDSNIVRDFQVTELTIEILINSFGNTFKVQFKQVLQIALGTKHIHITLLINVKSILIY